MSAGEHEHPVNPERVTMARAGVLSVDDAGRLAGLVVFRKDGRMVCYRLSDGFPHRLLEQCLRELLTIAAPDGER